ncbi:hypothetical protein D9M68_739270 [compost metagenome]
MLDLLGQAFDLGVERLHFIAARYAETRNGVVQALVEGFFQLAPLADRPVLDLVDLGLGAAHFRLDRGLHRIDLLLDFALSQFFGFFAVLDQRIEQLGAVLADLGVSPQACQPDLPRVFFNFADPGAGLLFGFLFDGHAVLLIWYARRARATRSAHQA